MMLCRRLPTIGTVALRRSLLSRAQRYSTIVKPKDESSTTTAPEVPDREVCAPKPAPKKTAAKTQAEADGELKRKLEKMSGEGGASENEFEDGKPASMKRSMREE